VDAYFEAAQQRGLLAIGGKVMMDRNAPEGLRDTAQSGYDASKTLIEKWQGQGRLHYAISPRFAPTSTSEQLEAAGSLWQEHPGCLMQTHLAEQKEEIAWVAELFPDHPDYLSVYESFGLSAPGAVFGHSIHLDEKMWQRLRERGASVAHCPTSNSFIGSGLFNALAAQKAGVPVGLATDTGGGSSFSMLRTMAAAYEIAQLGGTALHPYQLLWMATAGSAEALCQQDKIGRIEVGMDADLVVLDLQATTEITQRAERANSLSEELFPTIMLGDDRSIHQVYVAGRPVKP
jgi:guanine deaminase